MATTSDLLLQLLGSMLVYALLFAGGAVAIRRRFGRSWLWRSWAITSIGLALILMYRLAPFGSAAPIYSWFVMALPMIAIPSGAAALVADRLGGRQPPPHPMRQYVLSSIAFLGAAPVGMLVGSIPDFFQFF